ncbi:MAG: AAA family ATPase [Gammaproteobacteria bacterium]
MNSRIHITIAGRAKESLDKLETLLDAPEYGITISHISNGHSDPLFGMDHLPDLLVFWLSEASEEELRSLLARPAGNRPPSIIIGPAGDMDCMRMAMRAGARDYIEDPINDADLIAAIENFRQEKVQHQPGDSTGHLTAVVGAKGGSGASFLALNIAHMMVDSLKSGIALIDMDLQFGCLAQYLDIKPQHGLMPALDMAEHLDRVAIDAYMAKHKSGLALLGPYEEEIILTRDVPADRFGKLLGILKENYKHIVIDQPRQIDETTAVVYERADNILLVMQQELANVRDGNRLRTLLIRELGIPPDKIRIVINRYDKNASVEMADISRALGVDKSDFVLIPNSYRAVAESMNMGIPMLDHAPNSVVTKAIMKLESQLTGSDRGQDNNIFSRTFANLIRG